MDPSTRLTCLSLAMLVGCYIFGSIPLSLTISERNMRSVSIVGAGLIVGTALSVIIPEGVHAIYEQDGHGHGHGHGHDHEHHDHDEHSHEIHARDVEVAPAVPAAASAKDKLATLHEHLAPDVELHSMIGISLSLGFVFMLLVDHLCGHGGHSHGNGEVRRRSIIASIGLLVHAAADGVALGAAATTSRTDIEMIVFLAIMLHKAPAAFGLTSFLLHEGCERGQIRRHLLAFSLAAPIFALLTFYGLSQSGKEAISSVNGTGLAMLFSAGTFLYVATVHILPELLHSDKDGGNDAVIAGGHDHGGRTLGKKELLLLVFGIVLPVILGLYHKH